MSWWKRILGSIPLILTGYEVGKSIEEKDNKEAIDKLKNNIQINNEQILNKSSKFNYIEVTLLATTLVILMIYIIKSVRKFITKKVNNIATTSQQRI